MLPMAEMTKTHSQYFSSARGRVYKKDMIALVKIVTGLEVDVRKLKPNPPPFVHLP